MRKRLAKEKRQKMTLEEQERSRGNIEAAEKRGAKKSKFDSSTKSEDSSSSKPKDIRCEDGDIP